MSVLISNDAEPGHAAVRGRGCVRSLRTSSPSEGVAREVEISLSYVDEDEMHELNRQWRGIDRTTDVLSFECDSAL
ncbi:MAG: rRNA maturation RNase YbeY [Collinsella sp.]